MSSKSAEINAKRTKVECQDAAPVLLDELWKEIVTAIIESPEWLLSIESLLLTSKTFYQMVTVYAQAYPLMQRLRNSDGDERSVMVNNVYNYAAFKLKKEECVKRDFDLSSMLLTQTEIDQPYEFVKVQSRFLGLQRRLIYYPQFNEDLGEHLIYMTREPTSVMSDKLYHTIAQRRIQWMCSVLQGDIKPKLLENFGENIEQGMHRRNSRLFSRRVVGFMITHPHKDYETFGAYSCKIEEMVKEIDLGWTDTDMLRTSILTEASRILSLPHDIPVEMRVQKAAKSAMLSTLTQCQNNCRRMIERHDQ